MPTSVPEPSLRPNATTGRPVKLVRTGDYARVQASGRRLRASSFMVLVAPSSGNMTRVGLTVSRKVGCAVVRNRVKRWLREVLGVVGSPPGGPWDVVIVAYASAAEAGYAALLAQVTQAFGAATFRGEKVRA